MGANQIAIEMRGDDANLMRSLRSQQKEIDRLKDSLKRMSNDANHAYGVLMKGANLHQAAMVAGHRQFDRMFGQAALSSIANFAGQFVSAAGAIGLVVAGLRKLNQEKDAGVQRMVTAAPALARMGELAGTDPAKHAALIKQAKELSAFSGKSVEASAGVLFELQSGGAMAELPFFSKLLKARAPEEVTAMIGSAARVREAFGEEETGSLRDIVSKSLAAAEFTPKATSTMLLDAVAGAAGAGALAGLSDEEVFAGISRLAQTRAPEVAKTQFNAMIQSFIKQGVPGGTVGEMLTAVTGKNLTPQELIKFTGSTEAIQSFQALRDTGALGAREVAVAAGQRRDLAGTAVDQWLGQPAVGGPAAMQAAERQLESLTEDSMRIAADTYIKTVKQRMAEESPWLGMFAGAGLEAERFIRGDESSLRKWAGIRGLNPTHVTARAFSDPEVVEAVKAAESATGRVIINQFPNAKVNVIGGLSGVADVVRNGESRMRENE